MNGLPLHLVVLMHELSFQKILHPEKWTYTAWWLFLCNQHPDEKDNIIRNPKHDLCSFLIMLDFQQHALVLPIYNIIQMEADTVFSFVSDLYSALCLCNSSLSLHGLGDHAFPVLCTILPGENAIFSKLHFTILLHFLLQSLAITNSTAVTAVLLLWYLTLWWPHAGISVGSM